MDGTHTHTHWSTKEERVGMDERNPSHCSIIPFGCRDGRSESRGVKNSSTFVGPENVTLGIERLGTGPQFAASSLTKDYSYTTFYSATKLTVYLCINKIASRTDWSAVGRRSSGTAYQSIWKNVYLCKHRGRSTLKMVIFSRTISRESWYWRRVHYQFKA